MALREWWWMGGGRGDRGLLCFAGSMTVRVVQTVPVGLLLLSERLIQTRKDVFLQRKNSLLADDLFSRKIVMIQFLTKNSKIDTGRSMLIRLQAAWSFSRHFLQYWKLLVYYLSLIYLPFPSSEEWLKCLLWGRGLNYSSVLSCVLFVLSDSRNYCRPGD